MLSILYMLTQINNALRTIIAILQVRKLRNGSLSNMPVIIKLKSQHQHLNPQKVLVGYAIAREKKDVRKHSTKPASRLQC